MRKRLIFAPFLTALMLLWPSPIIDKLQYFLPKDITFAGQQIPTEYWFVEEGLNDWLITMQSQPATVCKYIRRAAFYEPLIKEKLKAAELPEDLFYIAVIESGLNSSVRSWAGAVGLWQFIGSTGKIYKLNDKGVIDERKLVEESTDAAIRHFKDLYAEFNDWFLAGAAYNAGAGRVREMILKYKTRNYWLLKFPKKETQDYMYRAVVMKEVMQNLEKYGFSRDTCAKCSRPPVKIIRKKLAKYTSLINFAKELQMEYMEFIKLNPAYENRECLPAGTYEFIVPTNIEIK